jgi:hypothetical protein
MLEGESSFGTPPGPANPSAPRPSKPVPSVELSIEECVALAGIVTDLAHRGIATGSTVDAVAARMRACVMAAIGVDPNP